MAASLAARVVPVPRPVASGLRLAELVGGLGRALDLAEGQPEGHSLRCCWVGMRIGSELKLAPSVLADLYYTLLLKDLGGSAIAGRIFGRYNADDLAFKHDHKVIGDSLPQVLRFVLTHPGPKSNLVDRLQDVLGVALNGGEIAGDLIAIRSDRGAEIARRLRFPDGVVEGIRSLDEHWDGQGRPAHLAGEQIPLTARIALLAQVVEAFYASSGRSAALSEVQRRSETWFDPAMVAAFETVAADRAFWEMLRSPQLEDRVFDLEPTPPARRVDERCIDDIAAAFGGIVDAKSRYSDGHSARVARYAVMIAEELGLPPARRRWLRRAALLHDIGKLGVPNTILDKADPLTPDEWLVLRAHAATSEAILSRIPAFGPLALVAGAHHERLDGKGYPRGLKGDRIPLDTRILSVADVFDALTARRPYREAMSDDKALAAMDAEAGIAFDRKCLAALRSAVAKRHLFENL